MSKFSVGETVWVKPFKEIHDLEHEDNFTLLMSTCCEKSFFVKEIYPDDYYFLRGTRAPWVWKEDWLESEEEHQMRVKGKEKEEKKEESKK